jgi:predicted esterase
MGTKVLFLHGYGGNAALAEGTMLDGLKEAMPDARITVLEGHRRLWKSEHMAQLTGDKGGRLKEAALKGSHEGLSYGYIECPPASPDDPTLQVNADGVRWAKMSRTDMQSAVWYVADFIEDRGGFDMVCGFSQGGEVIAELFKQLPTLNGKLATPVRMLVLFGTRNLYSKYGLPAVQFAEGAMKACVTMGRDDHDDQLDKADGQDLQEFEQIWSQAGVNAISATYEGGHEMPRVGDPVYRSIAEHCNGGGCSCF